MTIHAEVNALAGAGYEVILADPPWSFKSNSKAKPGRNASRHYETMTLDAIAALNVKAIVAKDAALFFWITPSFLAIGAHIPIMKAWGFAPSSVAFTWVKSARSHPWHHKVAEKDLHFGTGLTTRKQTEVCLLGTRGRSLRVDGGVPEVIIAAVREHSRKPDEAIHRIGRYVGPGRKQLEMFSRAGADGWDAIGNESGKFDQAAE